MFIILILKLLELAVRLYGMLLEITEAWRVATELPPIFSVITLKLSFFQNRVWIFILKIIRKFF
jgi:hypothetical protein